jgi:DNA-binding NarL/FixJ family response regulator
MGRALISVIVVDDFTSFWEGMFSVISGEGDISVTGFVKNVSEAIRVISSRQTDILILNIPMPNQSTLSVIKYLKKLFPGTRVLLMVVHLDVHYALRAFKCGVAGYFPRGITAEEITKAIRKAHSGGKYVIPWLAGKLVEELNSPTSPPPHEHLTDREFLVMQFIAKGKTPGEIASALKITEKTVASYRTRILLKMRLKSIPEITKYVHDNLLCQ